MQLGRMWRVWRASAVSGASAALAIATLITPDWIEITFGVDPDRGNGALEWAIVATALVTAASAAAVARSRWRRALSKLRRPAVARGTGVE